MSSTTIACAFSGGSMVGTLCPLPGSRRVVLSPTGLSNGRDHISRRANVASRATAYPDSLPLFPEPPSIPSDDGEAVRRMALGDVSRRFFGNGYVTISPYDAPQSVHRASTHLDPTAYPEKYDTDARADIATMLGVADEHILVTAGGTAGIGSIFRSLVRPGDDVVMEQPNYTPYYNEADLAQARVVAVPLSMDLSGNYCTDIRAMIAAITPRTRLVVLCDPHNPVGATIPNDQRRYLPDVYAAAKCVGAKVLIDQAFYEYAGSHDVMSDEYALQHASPQELRLHEAAARYPQESCLDGTAEWRRAPDTVIVLRTGSKGLSCAGFRIGWLLGAKETIDIVKPHVAAYSVTTYAVKALCASLKEVYHIRAIVDWNRRNRRCLQHAMRDLGFETPHSDSSCIVMKVPDGRVEPFLAALQERGVLARDATEYRMPGYLRFAIGTSAETEHAIRALTDLAAREPR